MTQARSRLRHLPNALTILRLLMALPIAALVVADESVAAMSLFIAAGISDGLDGWLAKRYGWQTQLGGWLDPLADKALVLSVCTALMLHGDLPPWLFALIAIRDAVIVGGALAFHFNFAPLYAAPTLLGKLTTLAMLLLVVTLLWHNISGDVVVWLVDGLIYVCTALLLASGIDYVRRWSGKARRIARHAANQSERRP
ncbi:MAG: CDP-alcohol phosphatidyltransferase family protein [Rhodanobacteraceae bacterium]|nr:CDP-alcohol phosphatidyltransferase family protein [Rhodanobacteraceae bacterium]